jgi:hypothetical protein
VKRSSRGSPAAAVAHALLAITLSLGASACAAPRPPAPAPALAAAPSQPAQADPSSPTAEDRDQAEGQRAWCGYLQALYVRASEGEKTWPKYRQCTSIRTPAAPAMLSRTADCAMRALQRFSGDPFTPAYATEVSRCGSDVIEALTAPASDVAPLLALVCERAAACGQMSATDCRAMLENHVGSSLRRAVGALNGRGRSELRACLGTSTCTDLGEQISGCLEPIMDRLLWLPPG